MSNLELDSLVQKLKEQESNVLEILAELKVQESGYQADLERIQNALAALETKPKAARKRRASGKPSPSRSDVELAIERVRQQCSPTESLSNDQLRQAVDADLAERGFSRSGLALRFKQILESKEVVGDSSVG